MNDDDGMATATINVLNIVPVRAGRILALADVAITLDGVEVIVHGVQVRADAERTEVLLPTYRSPDGRWLPAISLPDELRTPMADTVLAAGLEAGLLRQRTQLPAGGN